MTDIDEAALIVTKSLVLRKPFYYSSLPDQLVKSPKISPGAKIVYALMHAYCPRKKVRTENAVVEIALKTLAGHAGVTEKSAQKYVRELVKAGWITRVRGGNQGHSSRYRLWPVSTAEFEGRLAHARVMEKLKRDHGLGRRLTASLYPAGKKLPVLTEKQVDLGA
jgi:DNA-binding MarR family transcriptional regulator